MAVRWRRYYSQCKPIACTGKRSKACPTDLPRRANGAYKSCGTWCIEFFDQNKEWLSLTFKDIHNKSDAERRYSLLISDRERGRLSLPRKKYIPTLAVYAQRYLETYSTAKENTKLTKLKLIKTLTRYLGEYRLDRITPFLVERFVIDRKEKDKVRDSTINDDLTALTHIFYKAIKEGFVDKNPCIDVKRQKVSQKRDRILNADEISLLLNKLQGKDLLAVLFGFFCGLRLNETLKLTWDSFDFTKGVLSFVASKTGKLVTIPLSSYLMRELNTYKNTCTSNNLFVDGEVVNSVVSEYSHYFSVLFKGLGIHGFTYHNLRHTFASLQADLGVGAITTKEMLGHSSLDMTLRYSHTGLESKKRAIETMTEHVISIAKNETPPVALKA